MNPEKHAAAKCRDRENCTGTGCRLHTGKTARKRGGSATQPPKKEKR